MDTSKETVERLAERMLADCECTDAARYQPYTDSRMREAAKALRALLAERDRMRGALMAIAWAVDDGCPGPDLRSCIGIARNALKGDAP